MEEPARAQVVPSRDDIAVVYRYLRSKGNLSAPDEVIYAKLRGNISCLCKLKLAIDVLDEMHLVTRGPGGQACGGGAQSAEGGYLPVENPAGAAIPKPAGRHMNRQPGCGQSPVMEEANEILCN